MLFEHVTPNDWNGVRRIVNHYIEHSVANLKLEGLDEQSFEPWITQFADHGRCQMLVAKPEPDSDVTGFACSTPFNPRGGYAQTVWTSVYIDPEHTRRGLGATLYRRLFELLKNEPIHRILAGITLPNNASVALHNRFGFKEVGVMNQVGFKAGAYHDVLWLEKRFSEEQ